MCVVIVRSPQKEIPVSHLENGNRANPHGWGIMARKPDGTLVQKRGFSTPALVDAYKELGAPENEVVVHCRIGTSGTNDLKNTHPFKIVPGAYLFHNGIFSDIKLTTPGRNDTWHLAQQLRPLFEFDFNIRHDEKWQANMLKYCTSGYANKLVIMTKVDTVIINDKAGTWREGVWYSNSSAFWTTTVKPIVQYFNKGATTQTATATVTSAEKIIAQQFAERQGRKRLSRTERRAYAKRASQIMRLRSEQAGDLVQELAEQGEPDFYGHDEQTQRIAYNKRKQELQEAFAIDNAKWEAHVAAKVRSLSVVEV